MTIEPQDYDRAIRDLEEALKDPRNEAYRETIEHSIYLLKEGRP
jgi:hypothetical protein